MIKIVAGLAVAVLLSLMVPPGSQLRAQDAFDVTADRLLGRSQGGSEVVALEGNVRIVHGSTVATADSGFYQKQAERLELVGNVVLRHQGAEVRGSRCDYLKAERRVIFPRGLELVEAGGRLIAGRGSYDIERDSLEVEGDVVWSDSLRSLSADRAVYLRAENRLEAWGNVVIRDDDYGASVKAGELTYLRALQHGTARLRPVLEILPQAGREAMTVTSDSMEVFGDRKQAIATGNVAIARGEVSGTCGRAVFLDLEDKSVLHDGPVMTEGESSISGDSITIFSRDEAISRAVVSGNAKCIYRPEEGEGSELTGSEIEMLFSDEEISQMKIERGATGVFLPAPGDTSGARNEVHGQTMTLGFEGGEATTATVSGKVKGTYTVAGQGAGGGQGAGAEAAVRPDEDAVLYESDSLHYDVPGALMNLVGAAVVTYGEMRLNSEAIEYNSRSYNLYAPVDPILWEGKDKITGSSLSYNLKTKRGAIAGGRTRFDKGIYTGGLIRKTGETTLNVEHGVYTSCDHADPHYSFTSSRMKIEVGDKVIVRPVVLRIRGVPVLALPFYMFPIKQGRHSGILLPRVELGLNQEKGKFVRNVGYYLAPNDYFDVAAWGDYYERSRWVAHAETRYSVRYLLNGSFDGSYTRDIVTDNSRWDLGGSHTQNVGENGKLVLHADFVSDKTYRRDISDDLEKALRRVLESDASYSRSWDDLSLNLAAERRENLDTDEISAKLPSASLLLTRRTLLAPGKGDGAWHKGTYLSGSSNFTATSSKTGEKDKTRQAGGLTVDLSSDLSLAGGTQAVRSRLALAGERKDLSEWCSGCVGGKAAKGAVDLKTDLIARLKPGGAFNLSPSLSVQGTVYDQDKAGKTYATRVLYSGSVDLKASLYRTYFPRLGPLAALRHVVSPSVTFTHRPDFSKYKDRFFSLSGISSEVTRSSTINISLSNRLQAKLGSGAQTRKIDDLLILSTSATCDLLYRDNKKPAPFSTIQNQLRLRPTQYASLDLNFSHEPVHLDLESFDLQTNFTYTGKGPLPPGLPEAPAADEPRVPEEGVGGDDAASPTAAPWRFNAAYRYIKGFDGAADNSWLEVQAGFNITRNWRVEYGGRFDLSGRQTVYQEYSIYRDLHCWEAQFVRRYSDDGWEYYVRINIKAHPEIYAERGLRALYRAY